MPEPTNATLAATAKAALKEWGSTSLTLLAALALITYANMIGVPALVDDVRANYAAQNRENAMREAAAKAAPKGIKWNEATQTWEPLP